MEENHAWQILAQYNSIFKESDQIYRTAAKSFGLSDCAFWILYSLREASTPLTQSDICNQIYLPKQTVNSALKKLEADGIIVMEEMTDRSSKRLALTQKGQTLAARTADRVLAAEHDAFLGLSAQEQEEFIRLFRKYTDILKQNMTFQKEEL